MVHQLSYINRFYYIVSYINFNLICEIGSCITKQVYKKFNFSQSNNLLEDKEYNILNSYKSMWEINFSWKKYISRCISWKWSEWYLFNRHSYLFPSYCWMLHHLYRILSLFKLPHLGDKWKVGSCRKILE